MPTLSENCADLQIFRRSLVDNSTAMRPTARNVRRCLFGPVDEDARKKTDQWLEDQLAEIRLENRQKASKWGFDFENDSPLSFSAENEDSLQSDYQWTACPADYVPSFYSRPPHQKADPVAASHDLVDRTPVKSFGAKKPSANQLAADRKILTASKRLATSVQSECAVAAAATVLLQPVKTGLLEPIQAGLSETTPYKPADKLAAGVSSTLPCQQGTPSSSYSIDDKMESNNSPKFANTMVIQRRKNMTSQNDDQSKLTHFFPLRKRSRRSTPNRLGEDKKIISHVTHVDNRRATNCNTAMRSRKNIASAIVNARTTTEAQSATLF